MTASLMAYAPGARVPTMSAQCIVPDLPNNRFYSTSSSTGVSQFTGYVSGDVSLAKTRADIGIAQVTDNPVCLTYNGNLVFPAASGVAAIQLIQLRASDLSLLSTNFAQSADSSPSNATHMLSPEALVPMRAGRTDFVVATPFSSNLGEVSVIAIPGLQLTNLGNTVETGTATLCRGTVGATSGTAYVVGRGTNVFSLYRLTVGIITVPVMAQLRTFTPANIDATWATFSLVNGATFDQTDSSVIVGVQTADAVAVKSYICKLNGTTGALVWKVPVPYIGGRADEAFRVSIIKNGRFYVWGDNQPGGALCHTINTVAGTVSSVRVGTMSVGTAGVSEDINDSITTNAGWAQSATVPNYIGTYMGTLGNHGYSGWMRFFPNGPTAPLPPAPPPTPTPAPLVSVNRAWSYILDGHTFYVLDLGAQGTFAFDTTTGAWSEFVTGLPSTTYGTPSPQWNFQNGCMWGTRIVGGDLATPTIYEMTPSAILDNDVTPISHVATGGIAVRNRVYRSVEAVRVSASFGLLDSTSPVNFNLRFSDDQGHTWSPYYTVSLTPGDYTTEIAWRSLGSFAAPGRIFELSDTGGLIRIDGMDVFLDNFDTDPQEQGG